MARTLESLLLGFGTGVAEGYTKRKEKEREAEAEFQSQVALARAKAQAEAEFDPVKLAQARLLNLAGIAGRVPEPLGGYNPAERQAGFPEEVAGAAQERETNILRHLLPRQPLSMEDIFARSQAQAAGRQSIVGDRQRFLDSTKLREEFLNRPEVKEYVTINTNVRTMDSLLARAKAGDQRNRVALDQALITMYNKLTDPSSVVRESEYARTPQNLPFLNRWAGAFQKLEQGGAGLTDADREALVWGAKVIGNERGRTFNETLQSYETLGSQYDFDVPSITRGLTPHQAYTISGATPKPTVSPEQRAAYNRAREAGQTPEQARRSAEF